MAGGGNILKHGILGLLSYTDMTGYQLMTVFRDSLNYFWTVQTSQIYRELQNMKASGWVSDVAVEQTDRPDKKVFSLTEAGRAELEKWLAEDYRQRSVKNELLMKTFFLGEREPEKNIEFFRGLTAYSGEMKRNIEKNAAVSAAYADMMGAPEKKAYWDMTAEFGMMYADMLGEWSRKCVKKLEDMTNENADN